MLTQINKQICTHMAGTQTNICKHKQINMQHIHQNAQTEKEKLSRIVYDLLETFNYQLL